MTVATFRIHDADGGEVVCTVHGRVTDDGVLVDKAFTADGAEVFLDESAWDDAECALVERHRQDHDDGLRAQGEGE